MEQIPEDVLLYRKEWLKDLPKWYSAKWHYFGTTAVSIPLMAYALNHLIRSQRSVNWKDLAAAPIFLLFASLVEYVAHRYPLHHKYRFSNKTYLEHTLKHHQYYTDVAIEANHGFEYYQVLFPVWGVAFIQYCVNLPFSLLMGWLFEANTGYVGLLIGVGFFFAYETIHAICHFPHDSMLFKIPVLFKLREHHRIHHRKSLMGRYNFNIVAPIWDWFLGTKHN